MKKINVAYFGTPEFSVPTLDMLANHPDINLKYVISMPDRPAGRGQQLKSPEVIEYAKAHKISYFQTSNINKEEDFLKTLENENIDLFIVLAFAQFLGTRLLNLPKIGCFNIHTSLLPKYRGAAPIQYALLNGDQTSGVSIQKMVKKMDAGDLVHSYPIDLSDNETGGQLYTRLKFQAALSTNAFLKDVKNNNLTFTRQDESQVSFAPTLKKEDGHLDFRNSTMSKIKNQIRALDPWPGTYCMLGDKRLKVYSALSSQTKLKPNEVSIKNGFLEVGCLDGSLRLKDIQLQGKKQCEDIVFLNGWRQEIQLS